MDGAFYLTKSKIRGKLLGVLFSNSSRKYYLSELSRLIGTSAGNAQRELSRFVKDRLIVPEKRGNLVFYSLNRRHPFFKELRSLVLKTWGVEGALRSLADEEKDIEFALLYGSFAQGTQHGDSDIDFLVVSSGGLKDFYPRLARLESLFGREINPTVYSVPEFKRKISEGEGTFISRILKGPHRVLKGTLKEFTDDPQGI